MICSTKNKRKKCNTLIYNTVHSQISLGIMKKLFLRKKHFSQFQRTRVALIIIRRVTLNDPQQVHSCGLGVALALGKTLLSQD